MTSRRASHDFSDPKKQIQFGYQKTMENKTLLQAFCTDGISGALQRMHLTRKTRKPPEENRNHREDKSYGYIAR